MVWLTGLADVMRRTGYPVVEVAGWKTRGFFRTVGGVRRGDLVAVHGVICHHTATPWTAANMHSDYPSLQLVTNGRAGLAGPLAQLGLGRSGTWYIIAAGFANHAGVVPPTKPDWGGSYNIGIEAEAAGTGDPRDWPAAQMDSYARGCRVLMDADGFPLGRVLGHKEIAYPAGRKIDPSFDMNAFRQRVATSGSGGGGVTPTPTPDPGPEEDVVTQADRDAIAAQAAQAVTAALGPQIERAVAAAMGAQTLVNDHETRDKARTSSLASGLDEDRRVADSRYERRDRLNTRSYGGAGGAAGSYAELVDAFPTYLALSGAVIRPEAWGSPDSLVDK